MKDKVYYVDKILEALHSIELSAKILSRDIKDSKKIKGEEEVVEIIAPVLSDMLQAQFTVEKRLILEEIK